MRERAQADAPHRETTVKNRSITILGAIGIVGLSIAGCSSNSASSESASPSASPSGSQAFCSAVKEAEAKLKTLGEELASGNAAKQSQAIQQLTNYYNELLAELPANQSAAISQALADAKSNVSKGAKDPNYQASIAKLNEAIKKQCPNL